MISKRRLHSFYGHKNSYVHRYGSIANIATYYVVLFIVKFKG